MSITIKAASFSKRKNSTKIPAEFPAEYTVALKDACEEERPHFILNAASFPYNYVQWGDAYYYVDSVVYRNNNLLDIGCVLDPLATYKADILNTTAFVAYDTTTNAEITDKRISTKTSAVRAENAGNAFEILGKGYCVVINVVGEYSCASYAMDVATATTLLNSLGTWVESIIPDLPDPEGFSIEEIVGTIGNSILYGFRQLIGSNSAASCIKSAYLLPFRASDISGTSESITLGMFDTGVTAKRITSRGVQDATYVAIPWQSGDWRRNAPFTDISLYIPFVGVISVSPSAVMGASGLYVNVAFDQTAGDAIFTVSTSAISAGVANKVIGQYTANIAANFAIGSAQVTATQLITSIGATAGVVAASLVAPPAGIAAGTAGIVAEYNAVQPVPSSIGSAGGGAIVALFGYAPRCMVIYHDTIVAPDSVSVAIGTPSNAVKALSTLSGYVECRAAHVSAAAHASILDQIDSYLNSGFYIE